MSAGRPPAIGTPWPRPDAPIKAAGLARYVGDVQWPGTLEGALVLSPFARGRVGEVDTAAARAVPGVAALFSAREPLPLRQADHWALGQTRLPFGSDEIGSAGDIVALVLGETPHAAREGAARLRIRYEPGSSDVRPLAPGMVTFSEAAAAGTGAPAGELEVINDWAPSDTAVGNVDQGLAQSAAIVAGHYETANRHHAAIEPAVALARWEDGTLDFWTSTQWVFGVRAALALVLDVPEDRIRVRAEYVGGGFGAKGSVWPHEMLAAAAARAVGRPVRIVVDRRQSFALHGYQPATIQGVRLGAVADGRLTALEHRSVSLAARADDYVEHGSLGTRSLYACPNLVTRDRVARRDVPQPTFMRAPHEGPGMVGLEIAMDELAEALEIDPVELRLRNEPDRDPTSGKPFSSRALAACYREGAAAFRWAERDPRPRSMRDGRALIGWGMATALMSTFRFGSSARVTLERTGGVVIETAAHDIGSGIRAALPLLAAEVLGVEPQRVEVRLGDTRLPEAGGTFGSATTIGVGSAVHAASVRLRARLEELAGEPHLEAREYPELLVLRRLESVSETASWAPRREEQAFGMNAYGAVFVEVRVDEALPVPRVSRVVGAYSVGRIINPLTARSQLVGGVIWGLGQALLEASPLDPRSGQFVPTGFATYRIPGCADAPAIDVRFIPEHDPHASPLGVRGVGEIGTIGVAAAVANAVYHATGIRVRRVPIRIEHLLGGV